jgi:hypothetical protein
MCVKGFTSRSTKGGNVLPRSERRGQPNAVEIEQAIIDFYELRLAA